MGDFRLVKGEIGRAAISNGRQIRLVYQVGALDFNVRRGLFEVALGIGFAFKYRCFR